MHLDDCTVEEIQALQGYKAARLAGGNYNACFDMNLRLDCGCASDELPYALQVCADALDSVFARLPAEHEESVLFRGTGFRHALGRLQVGDYVRRQCFWSASRSRAVAANFIKTGFSRVDGALLRLIVPAGYKMYDLETVEGAGNNEQELLLSRGIMWRVDDVVRLTPQDLGLTFAANIEVTLCQVDLTAVGQPRTLA